MGLKQNLTRTLMSKRYKAAYLRALCRDKRKTERKGRREKVCVCERERMKDRRIGQKTEGQIEKKIGQKISIALCKCMYAFFEISL